MSNQAPEIITKYEVMFALRTGVTVLVQKISAFDGCEETPPRFKTSPENSQDMVFVTAKGTMVLKGMKKEHIAAAIERGFIIFYEMKGEDIIRNTTCLFQA